MSYFLIALGGSDTHLPFIFSQFCFSCSSFHNKAKAKNIPRFWYTTDKIGRVCNGLQIVSRFHYYYCYTGLTLQCYKLLKHAHPTALADPHDIIDQKGTVYQRFSYWLQVDIHIENLFIITLSSVKCCRMRWQITSMQWCRRRIGMNSPHNIYKD